MKQYDNDNDGKMDSRLQTKLTRSNWNTEFKDYFKDLAISYGEAGTIILTEQDVVFPEPNFNETRGRVNENNEAVLNQQGNQIRDRVYDAQGNGYRIFTEDKRRYESLKENKNKLITKLLHSMEKDIRDRVASTEGFQQALATSNLLQIWQITEQVVNGRGAVSVYAITTKLIGLRQVGSSYTQYVKEFRDSVTDLMRQGQAQVVLDRIFNTLFILGLNQEQFKERLTPIFGTNDWPEYDVLAAELQIYAEATERMHMLTSKDKTEGKISAHVTKYLESTRSCWNCGRSNHLKSECNRPLHECKVCRDTGHLERFCLNKDNNRNYNNKNNNYEQKENNNKNNNNKNNTQNSYNNYNSKKQQEKQERYNKENNKSNYSNNNNNNNKKNTGKPNNNKSKRRSLLLQQAKANLTYEEDDYDQEENYDENQNEDESDEDNFCGLTDIIEVEQQTTIDNNSIENVVTAMLNTNNFEDKKFIIDSGCKGAHICTDSKLLMNAKRSDAVKVKGITGHSLTSTHVGELPIGGRTFCVPNADANLISLKLLLKDGGRFSGNNNELNVFDSKNKLILVGKDHGDGYWTCNYSDFTPRVHAYNLNVNNEEEKVVASDIDDEVSRTDCYNK